VGGLLSFFHGSLKNHVAVFIILETGSREAILLHVNKFNTWQKNSGMEWDPEKG
jgi:hypothetical protein